MFRTDETFHKLSISNTDEAPKKFTYPFNYTPHKWVKIAADELKNYLSTQHDFEYHFGWDEVSVGKMFGILIVEKSKGEVGYLAAFSGKINEINNLDGFVPPIFDILNPDDFYKRTETELNSISQKIVDLENSMEYLRFKQKLNDLKLKEEEVLTSLKVKHKAAKIERDTKRVELQKLNKRDAEDALNQLIDQSKRNHFELKDQKKIWKSIIKGADEEFKKVQHIIDLLKKKRKIKSSLLQAKLHNAYNFLNAKNEEESLMSVFEPFHRLPPAGAGECAAPRLLQYAYNNNLRPLAMGEFWWGKAPNAEIRRHGDFYPSCKSKCEPILHHMLKGLDVEQNPILEKKEYTLDVVYEDDHLMLVNKPAGVLSVPGKKLKECLQQKVEEYLGKDYLPLLVHRLDMATSGLVLVAKNMQIHKKLQQQFIDRTIKKSYTAILDGGLSNFKGKIDLPLRVDLDNRPMQLVCYEYGKQALTYYQVIKITDLGTRIKFYPVTGRTHQLRVHAAHHKGLGIPILGDDLYGSTRDRLYLHATELEFQHPITNKLLKFNSKPPF